MTKSVSWKSIFPRKRSAFVQMAIAALELIRNQTEIITKLVTICLYDCHAFYELYSIEDIIYLITAKTCNVDLPKVYFITCIRIPHSLCDRLREDLLEFCFSLTANKK